MNTASEDELLASLGMGEAARREAVSELYRRYAQRFMAYLQRRGISRHEAEELVQEAFMRLIRRADTFAPRGQGNAWIWQVARSAWLDAWKKNEPLSSAESLEGVAEPMLGITPDIASQSDFQDCVHGQLSRFIHTHPEGGQAILWAAVDGLDTEQISALLGRTAGAARQFLSQARKRLREYLQPCLED